MAKPGSYGWSHKEKTVSELTKPVAGEKGMFYRRMFREIIKQIEINVLHCYNMRPMVKYLMKKYQDHETQDLVGCEIGVGFGHNSYNILYNLPVKRHYLVDPYLEYEEWDGGQKQSFHDTIYNEARKYLAEFGDRAIFIRKKSEEAVKEIKEPLDFVYIDGNHWYEFVKKDIDLFYPKVKSGGVIGGHDFIACRGVDVRNAEVPRAVIDFIDCEGLELDGHPSDWWVVKP